MSAGCCGSTPSRAWATTTRAPAATRRPTPFGGGAAGIAISMAPNGVVGPGRAGHHNQRRTPQVVNIAFAPSLMWNARFSATRTIRSTCQRAFACRSSSAAPRSGDRGRLASTARSSILPSPPPCSPFRATFPPPSRRGGGPRRRSTRRPTTRASTTRNTWCRRAWSPTPCRPPSPVPTAARPTRSTAATRSAPRCSTA